MKSVKGIVVGVLTQHCNVGFSKLTLRGESWHLCLKESSERFHK